MNAIALSDRPSILRNSPPFVIPKRNVRVMCLFIVTMYRKKEQLLCNICFLNYLTLH